MFQFTKDCVLGVEELDEDHAHLFELLNEGTQILQNNYKEDRYVDIVNLLEELEEYAEIHFVHEETYMEKLRDPELIRQRSQHMFFRDKIREYLVHNLEGEENQQQILMDLMNFLAHWLYHHIIGSDIMIGKLPPLEEWMIRENPCEFVNEYRTGIDKIDEEHKKLFEIVDRAYSLVRAGNVLDKCDDIMEILEELKEYTKFHFVNEEMYMESINYEGLAAQKRAHEAFIDKLSQLDKEQIQENPQEYMESLIEFLLGWLVNHILHLDKKIPA